MMMVPRRNGFGFFDDFFEDEFFKGRTRDLMRTDIREKDDKYIVDIDLPGFKKDEINAQLDNGYLTISASKGLDKDEGDKKGRYIRRERYAGSMSRSFYVGDVKPEEVSAKFENGILTLDVPKAGQKKLPENNRICIE